MSDLISRQAAIEAAFEWDGTELIEDVLSRIPAAQQWIPVTERLPKREQYYIITYGELVTTCHWFKGSWYGIGDPERVTAWMPLPEPYKEEQDETD